MIQWTCKPFDSLSPFELYAIIRLRNEVFVVEQECVFQDADNRDQACLHLTGWQEENLVAYCRLVPPGIAFDEPSIGRVLTDLTVRRSGTGRELMQRAISECRRKFGRAPIKIGAQLYLEKFYSSLGFVPAGGIYPEDGIMHVHMLLS
jgi:ElaA protein